MCELLANGIVKEFLYDTHALQYLINMEEQAKSFWLTLYDDCSSTAVNHTK